MDRLGKLKSRHSLTPSLTCRVPRDAFPGYDELVNIKGEPDDVLKVLLGDEVGDGDSDEIEPKLDD